MKDLKPQPILLMLAGAIAAVFLVLVILHGINKDIAPGGSSFEKTKTIQILDNTYNPKIARVKFDDVITWHNAGKQAHTVTFRALSKTLQPGEMWSWTIGHDIFTSGVNNYWCDFHRKQGMGGAQLIVE